MRRGILFLCVANSARSQMAEGIARLLAPEGVEIHSAGSSPATIHPLAVEALGEIDVDAAGQRSKGIDEVPQEEIGTVITLCAEEVCPVFPDGVRKLHWPMRDPAAEGLEGFREVRDEIRRRLELLFKEEG